MVDPIEVNKYYVVDSMPYLISSPVCTIILLVGACWRHHPNH